MSENTREDKPISIGELSRQTGVPVRTIRFYCDEGALEPQRTAVGHRVFVQPHVEQLLLIRRLRGLGLGLVEIIGVVAGRVSVSDALARRLSSLDDELAELNARRSAVHGSAHAISHPEATHAALVGFWRTVFLDSMPRPLFDAFVDMNVPRLAHDPTPTQLLAYAEMATLVAEPAAVKAMSRTVWLGAAGVNKRSMLLANVAAAGESVGMFLLEQPPEPGSALDEFVAVHAAARDTDDTPAFRSGLLRASSRDDGLAGHYWSTAARASNETWITATWDAHSWLLDALAHDVAARAS